MLLLPNAHSQCWRHQDGRERKAEEKEKGKKVEFANCCEIEKRAPSERIAKNSKAKRSLCCLTQCSAQPEMIDKEV
jgi:hypothetical protein